MKKIIIILLSIFPIISYSQNVGIGNPSPNEKLDVTGNINVSGTIKANGVDGTPNQMLMKNSVGLLSWGDMCEYKNYTSYLFTTAGAFQAFTVPPGVTKIKVQIWGGGGQSEGVSGPVNMFGGGGGGGYIEGKLTVTPGFLIYVQVGNGAGPGFTNSAKSQVSFGSILLQGQGGGNASFDQTLNRVTPGNGGDYVTSGTTSFIGMRGESGGSSTLRYDQVSSTEFGKAVTGANGGNAGNTIDTGGKGGFLFFTVNTAEVKAHILGLNGIVPGGGASSGAVGPAGGHGLVIIHY